MFTKEEKALFDDAVKTKVSSIKRAMNGAKPEFQALYDKELSAYTALSAKFAENVHEATTSQKR